MVRLLFFFQKNILLNPILEYRAACWDPYREGQIHALRQGAKESGLICTSHEPIEVENIVAE